MHINLSIESVVTIIAVIVVPLLVQLVFIGIIIGVYKATISFMQKQIEDLRADMKKYNNVLERMIRNEDSTKSAHRRIDEIINKANHNAI